MLLITSIVLAACGSLCLGRSLTTLPEKERPKTEQMQESETKEKDFEETQEPQNPMVKCYNKVVTEVANKI